VLTTAISDNGLYLLPILYIVYSMIGYHSNS